MRWAATIRRLDATDETDPTSSGLPDISSRSNLSIVAKLLNEEIKVWNDVYDYHSGETYGSIYADDNTTGKRVGYLKYSEWNDKVLIHMIEVAPEYQRQGIATRMLALLKQE